MIPIKSYTNLNKIIKFYFEWLKINNQSYSSELLKSLKKDPTIIILSLTWLNKKNEDIIQFQSNRYFLDALNITSLPHPEKIKEFSSKCNLGNLLNGNNSNKNINNLESLKALGLFLIKKFNDSVGIDLYLMKKWDLSKKNFYDKNGYVVIPDVMSSSECDDYRDTILKIANDETVKGDAYFYGFNNKFQRIYNLVNKSQKLGKLLTLPIVSSIMNDLFDRNTLHDKYTLSSWHGNIIPPKGEEQKFHLDSSVPLPLPPWIIRANINFIVEDYNENNGATICVPGSHKFLRKPTESDEIKYGNKLKKMVAPKGSMVIWSGHLWHKSGENKTNNGRVALLACFAASHLIEMALEENHSLVIDSDNLRYFSEDLKKLLLFDHGIKKGAKSKSKLFKK